MQKDNDMGANGKGEAFKPYVAPEKSQPELTVAAVIVGSLLAVVFGAANAYLGLRVGMTVSASIPRRSYRWPSCA